MGQRFRKRVQESAWQRKMREAVTKYMTQCNSAIQALNQAMEVTHAILDAHIKLSGMEDAIKAELEKQAEERKKEQEARKEDAEIGETLAPDKIAEEPVSGG